MNNICIFTPFTVKTQMLFTFNTRWYKRINMKIAWTLVSNINIELSLRPARRNIMTFFLLYPNHNYDRQCNDDYLPPDQMSYRDNSPPGISQRLEVNSLPTTSYTKGWIHVTSCLTVRLVNNGFISVCPVQPAIHQHSLCRIRREEG